MNAFYHYRIYFVAFLLFASVISPFIYYRFLEEKTSVEQYYKGAFLRTDVYYNGIMINDERDHIDLKSNDSLKFLRYNAGLLLIEKHRSMDSIAEAAQK